MLTALGLKLPLRGHSLLVIPQRSGGICFLSLSLHNFLRRSSPIHRNRRNLRGHSRCANSQLLAQLTVDPRKHVLVFLQEAAHILAALPDAFALKAVPRAAL